MGNLYTMDKEQLQANANQIKEVVVGQLVFDGKLTETQAEEFMRNTAVILYEVGFFGKMIDKLLGGKDKEIHYRMVRML